ncbi:uncharacterized protein LOC118204448 isoform X3 [Stegodyphus dumicola]|uniref:uncharacterized protein LOC118204448 isoform X3 n=1 Tax=Stegodyphus dumicola TaxID=202533 RepID=UPI0015B2665A|nr:uncharacterized protein LOC118204448 isoform X3 [Stegodyphus dumicola]
MEKIYEEKEDHKLEECTSKCKEDCEKFKYTYHFQERYERDKPNETMEESGLISVQIYLDVSEVIRYQHRPQYRLSRGHEASEKTCRDSTSSP